MTIRIQQAVWWQAAAYSPTSSGADFDPTQASGMSSLRLVGGAGSGVDTRYFTSASAGVLAGKACDALKSFTLSTIDSNGDGQNDTVVDQPTFGVRLGDPSLIDGRVIFNPTAQEALAIFGQPKLVINLEDFVTARVPLSFMLMAVYNSELSLSCSDRSLPDEWFKHSNIPSGIVDPVSADELREAMEPKPQTTSDGLNAGFYVKFERQAEITQIGCCGVDVGSSSSSSSGGGDSSSSSSSSGGGTSSSSSSSSSQAPPGECPTGPTLRSYQPAPGKTRIWAVRSGLRTDSNPKLLNASGAPEWSCFGPTPQELVYAEFDQESKLDTQLDSSVITWHHAGFLVLEDNYNRIFPTDFAGSSPNKSPFLGSMYDTLHNLPVDVVDIAWDDRGWLWALCTGPSRTEGTSSNSPESTVDGIYRVLPGGWSYHMADTFSWGGGIAPTPEVTAKLVASKVGKYKKVTCSGNGGGNYTFYLTVDGKVEYVHSASVSPVSPPADVFSPGAVVIDISAGESHACCVFEDGSLLAWAMDAESTSGTNHIDGPNSSTGAFTKVACRGKHTVALGVDGNILSWLDTGSVTTPVAAEGETVVDIGCGSGHVAALFNDPASGSNRVEITGTYQDGSAPGSFAGYDKFACGNNCTIVWRDSTSSLEFDGPQDAFLSNLPVVATVKQISIGDLHAVLVTEDGSLVSWGNSTSAVDHGVPLTYGVSPLSFDGQINKFESVSCGIRHTCVITDGTFYEPKYSPAVVAYRSKIDIASGVDIPEEPAAVMVESSLNGSPSPVRSNYDGTTILIGRSEYLGNPFNFSDRQDLKIYDDANKTIRILSANWRPLKSIASVAANALPETCGSQTPDHVSSSHKILPVTHDFSESDWTQADVDGLKVLQLPEFSGGINVDEDWQSELGNFPQRVSQRGAVQHLSPDYEPLGSSFDMYSKIYQQGQAFYVAASCFADSDFVPGSSVLLPISTQFFFNYSGQQTVSGDWAKVPSIMVGQGASTFESSTTGTSFGLSTIGREYLRSPESGVILEMPFLHSGWRIRSASVKMQYSKAFLQNQASGVLMPILHNGQGSSGASNSPVVADFRLDGDSVLAPTITAMDQSSGNRSYQLMQGASSVLMASGNFMTQQTPWKFGSTQFTSSDRSGTGGTKIVVLAVGSNNSNSGFTQYKNAATRNYQLLSSSFEWSTNAGTSVGIAGGGMVDSRPASSGGGIVNSFACLISNYGRFDSNNGGSPVGLLQIRVHERLDSLGTVSFSASQAVGQRDLAVASFIDPIQGFPTGFAASASGAIWACCRQSSANSAPISRIYYLASRNFDQITGNPADFDVLVNAAPEAVTTTTSSNFTTGGVTTANATAADLKIADGANPVCAFLLLKTQGGNTPLNRTGTTSTLGIREYELCTITGSNFRFSNTSSLYSNRTIVAGGASFANRGVTGYGGQGVLLNDMHRAKLFDLAFEVDKDSSTRRYIVVFTGGMSLATAPCDVCNRIVVYTRAGGVPESSPWSELVIGSDKLLAQTLAEVQTTRLAFCRSADGKLLLVESSGAVVRFHLLQNGSIIGSPFDYVLPSSSPTRDISNFGNKLLIVKTASPAEANLETLNFTLEIGNVEIVSYENGELRYSILVHMHPTSLRGDINEDPDEDRIPFLSVDSSGSSSLFYPENPSGGGSSGALGNSLPNEEYGVICSAPAEFGSAGVRYFFENTSSAFRVYRLSSDGFECVTRRSDISTFKDFGHGVLNDSYSLSAYRPLLEMPKNAPWGEMWSQLSANVNKIGSTANKFVSVGADVRVFLESSDDVSSGSASKNIPITSPITYRTYMNVRSAIVKATGDAVSALRSESSPGVLPYQRSMIRFSITPTITVPFGSAEPISIKPNASSLDRHSWMWWGSWVWQLTATASTPSIREPKVLSGIESWWHSAAGSSGEDGARDRSDFLDGYVTAASSASALVVGNSRCIFDSASAGKGGTMQLKVYSYSATTATNGNWTLAATVPINSVPVMGEEDFGEKYHPHSYLPQRLVLAVSDDANIICVAGHRWESGSIPGVPKNTRVTILKRTGGLYEKAASIVPPPGVSDDYFATKMEIQNNPGGGYRLNILCSTDPVSDGQDIFSYSASNKTHSYILDTQGTPAKVAECTDLLPPADLGFTNSGAANLNHWVATPSPAYNGNQTATWAGSGLVITTLNRIMSLESSRFGWRIQSHTERPFKFSDCKVLSSDFNTYQDEFVCPADPTFCSNSTDVPKLPSPAAGNQMSDGRVRASFFIPQTVDSDNDSGFYQVDNANSTQSGWFTAVSNDEQTLTLPHLAIGRALNSTNKDPQLPSADFDPGVQGRIFKVSTGGGAGGIFGDIGGDFGLVVRRPLFAVADGVSRLDWPFLGALTVLPKHFIRFSDEASAIRRTSANSLDIIDAGVITPTFNSANIIVLKDGLDRTTPSGGAVAYLAPSQWAERSKNVVPSGQLVSLRISNSTVLQRSATTTGIFPETGSARVSPTSQSFGIASPMAITVGGASACGAGAFDISKPCRSPIAPLEGRAFGSGSSPWMVVVERHTLDSTYFSYQGIDFGIRGISVTDATKLRMADPFSVSLQSPFDPLGHMDRMAWCANRSYKVAGWSVATKDVIFGHLRDILDPKFGNVYNGDRICLAGSDGLGDPDGITSYVWAYPTPVSGATTTKQCVCESDPYGGILWLKRLMSLPYTPKTSHLALRCLNGTGNSPDPQATMYSRFEAGASPLRALVFVLTADVDTANQGIAGASMASNNAATRESWAENVDNNLKSAEILTTEGGVHFVDLVKRPLGDPYRRACEILAEVSGGSYISLGRQVAAD